MYLGEAQSRSGPASAAAGNVRRVLKGDGGTARGRARLAIEAATRILETRHGVGGWSTIQGADQVLDVTGWWIERA